ncbi:hypothetical protein GQR58_029610 [Nymphon striatum]|nr:hypothetical protein GQR58_029610 [Nymphon striatum]
MVESQSEQHAVDAAGTGAHEDIDRRPDGESGACLIESEADVGGVSAVLHAEASGLIATRDVGGQDLVVAGSDARECERTVHAAEAANLGAEEWVLSAHLRTEHGSAGCDVAQRAQNLAPHDSGNKRNATSLNGHVLRAVGKRFAIAIRTEPLSAGRACRESEWGDLGAVLNVLERDVGIEAIEPQTFGGCLIAAVAILESQLTPALDDERSNEDARAAIQHTGGIEAEIRAAGVCHRLATVAVGILIRPDRAGDCPSVNNGAGDDEALAHGHTETGVLADKTGRHESDLDAAFDTSIVELNSVGRSRTDVSALDGRNDPITVAGFDDDDVGSRRADAGACHRGCPDHEADVAGLAGVAFAGERANGGDGLQALVLDQGEVCGALESPGDESDRLATFGAAVDGNFLASCWADAVDGIHEAVTTVCNDAGRQRAAAWTGSWGSADDEAGAADEFLCIAAIGRAASHQDVATIDDATRAVGAIFRKLICAFEPGAHAAEGIVGGVLGRTGRNARWSDVNNAGAGEIAWAGCRTVEAERRPTEFGGQRHKARFEERRRKRSIRAHQVGQRRREDLAHIVEEEVEAVGALWTEVIGALLARWR